jgi:cell division protein FtsB
LTDELAMARHSSFKSRSRGRALGMQLLAGVLVVVVGYLVYEFGRIRADYNIIDAQKDRQAYEQTIDELEAEIVSLKQEIALLETHRDIDREAYKEVEASLTALQSKIQEQTDAIAFYRGIVSPADGAAGLKVQDLRLTRGQEEHRYNVRLVLVQSLKHDRKVSGDVNLSVEGEQQGSVVTYEFKQLIPDKAKSSWPFSFRYFQDFDREIILPDGFTPERITIEVRSKTRSIDSIEESYNWVTSPG